VTTNATRLVDDLGPLNRAVLWFFEHASSGKRILARANYITQTTEENNGQLWVNQEEVPGNTDAALTNQHQHKKLR
jgi:hypothetical protein